MSFSEMMESGRGPGVIGMLLALLVLVGFGTLFMFAFDEGFQGADQSIESVIGHQAREISDLKTSIEDRETKMMQAPALKAREKELAVIRRENQYRESLMESLKTGVATANEAVTARITEFEKYKDDYRNLVRRGAKGEKMERLETRKGEVYENVIIREVTAIGIQIMHDGGHKRISFEELSTALQDRFQFDPKQKAAAVSKEEAQRDEHEAAVSLATAAEGQQMAERKSKEAEAQKDNIRRAVALNQMRLEGLQDEIEALEDALPKEGLKRISHAPQMRAQLANKQRERNALQAEISRMQSILLR